MNSKHLLIITPQVPYPPTGGGYYHSFRTILYLNCRCQVTVFMLDKTGDSNAVDELRKLLGHERVYSLPLNKKRNPITFAMSILVNKPLSVFRNYSPKARLAIEQLAENADAVFVDHYLMFQYVPRDFRGRTIAMSHNAEFLLWKRASVNANMIRAAVLKFEAWRVKRYEIRMISEVDAVLAFPNDAKAFREILKSDGKIVHNLPLGEDSSLLLPEIDFASKPPIVMFIGTLSWEANVDGLRWFLSSCWPHVRERVCDAQFWVGGTGGSRAFGMEIASYPGVKYLGFVADIETVYQQARVFAAPLRFGSGIKIKVLNALYRGMPVVTTPCGAEGIASVDDNIMRISGDPQKFASNVSELLTNDASCRSTARLGRWFVEKNFAGDKLYLGIDRALEGFSSPARTGRS